MPGYYTRGYTPIWQFTALRGTAAKALWTPQTSARIILTGLTISSAGPAGTLQFRFGNVGGAVIFEVATTGSVAPFSPLFEAVESTAYDRALFVEAASATTDGWRITASGFEVVDN